MNRPMTQLRLAGEKSKVLQASEPTKSDIPSILDAALVEPAKLNDVDSETASAVLGEISSRQMKLTILQGVLVGKVATWGNKPVENDVMLTAEQVAERLAVSPQWVYRNWKTMMPFGVKVSRKQLRFPARRVEQWRRLRAAA
jgi:hypothetical protein